MNLTLRISAVVFLGAVCLAICQAQTAAARQLPEKTPMPQYGGSRRVGKAHVSHAKNLDLTRGLVSWILSMDFEPNSTGVKESLILTLDYEVEGRVPVEPEYIRLRLDFYSITNARKYDGYHRVTIYTDDKLVLSEDAELLPPTQFPEKNAAFVVPKIRYQDFRRLLTAKKIAVGLGDTRIELEPGAIEAFNDLERTIERKTDAPRIGNIEDTRAVSQTVSCGFYFQFPNQRQAAPDGYIFISQMDGKDASMNLNGRDTRLKLVRISPYRKERFGARRRIDYTAAGGFAVRVETTVTGLSDENNYEPTRFKVVITVSKGAAKKIVRAIGYAGC